MDTFADVTTVLNPVLTPLGFSGGQGGGASTDGQIIWCAAFSQFARAFPWLPQATPDFEPTGHECVDLIAEVSAGRVVELTLEGVPVEETLRDMGLIDDAAQLASLLGAPATKADTRLASLLHRLFEPAISAGGEDPHL